MRPIILARTEELKSAINQFGCITIPQLTKFYPPSPTKYKNTGELPTEAECAQAVNTLISKRMAVADENGVIYPFIATDTANTEKNDRIIDAIWAFLEYVKRNPENPEVWDLRRELMVNQQGVSKITYVDADNNIVKITPVYDEGDVSKLHIEQESYKELMEEDDKASLKYVFVVRDKDMAKRIGEMNLPMNYTLALLDGKPGFTPDDYHFLSKKKK